MMTWQRTTSHPVSSQAPNLQSLWNTFLYLMKQSGFKGLYRGYGISVVVQAPAVATYLTTYDLCKDWMSTRWNKHSIWFVSSSPLVHLCSGFCAEAVSAFFWVPMEVLKQRVQVRSQQSNSFAALGDLLKYEGPKALFKGYFLTLGVFGPYSMIYFVCYEHFKSWGRKWNKVTVDEDNLPLSVILACAATSGAVAAACTTPLDVIKTRYQTQGDILYHHVNRYRNSWDAVRTIWRQEGVRAFFQGLSARVLWIMPGTAITMSTFEWLKKTPQKVSKSPFLSST
ncbi:mitochondrial carrier (BOU / S-adenosylmethionine carrier) [Galdieria sulphuraria]|uniref:Mitochondrial carrier (BOU / S-adenosylmethionine carrier) n=1 Tax=Galdieria sulphuraria TaxID=130081 RepID=M2WVC1_GALSU|nr:mitochondrial carrier (BOU / S-adenosylmethionine carrier) [Galdieria sulphuraria]EME27920.1 mitochondrial carrier (BOU / S-adenosylmethionine carrier) [Galdieria sulphuraria]|eukprot:XP_005704440.1 mitochondrial carrier (BOU / S-adenosylmethionine carrier) [Galdieria sulphuraria]